MEDSESEEGNPAAPVLNIWGQEVSGRFLSGACVLHVCIALNCMKHLNCGY